MPNPNRLFATREDRKTTGRQAGAEEKSENEEEVKALATSFRYWFYLQRGTTAMS